MHAIYNNNTGTIIFRPELQNIMENNISGIWVKHDKLIIPHNMFKNDDVTA